MKKIYLLLFFAFGFIFYGASAEAEEYLFSFNTPAVMPFSADSTIEAVNAEHGLYTSSDEEYLKELLDAGIISYYEPMGYVELFDYAPDDKYYGNQKAYMDMINVPFAWNRSNFGEGVRIALIDSGLSFTASEFPKEYVTRAYDFINPSAPSSIYCEDKSGHGTFVAGIISAEHNNRGITGIAPHSSLYIFRCFDAERRTKHEYIISAIYKAVDEYDCDIINMSFGGNSSTSLKEAVDYASSKGVLIVAAAGNDGKNSGDNIYYPAAYENVLCVGSVNALGHRATHSQQNDYVNIMAPGEDVWSVSLTNAGYGASRGTSFAVPHVTAAAALAKSLCPSLTCSELKDMLCSTATPMIDRYSGCGRLNVSSLLTLARAASSPGTFVYSISQDGYACAFLPPEGFTGRFAVFNDNIMTKVSKSFIACSEADFAAMRLFVWDSSTLSPLRDDVLREKY